MLDRKSILDLEGGPPEDSFGALAELKLLVAKVYNKQRMNITYIHTPTPAPISHKDIKVFWYRKYKSGVGWHAIVFVAKEPDVLYEFHSEGVFTNVNGFKLELEADVSDLL